MRDTTIPAVGTGTLPATSRESVDESVTRALKVWNAEHPVASAEADSELSAIDNQITIERAAASLRVIRDEVAERGATARAARGHAATAADAMGTGGSGTPDTSE